MDRMQLRMVWSRGRVPGDPSVLRLHEKATDGSRCETHYTHVLKPMDLFNLHHSLLHILRRKESMLKT